MDDKNIIIIGSGIAGIVCTMHLLDNNFQGYITIIEAGNTYDKRNCAVDKGEKCTNCSPCNTISGFSGSVHYGDTVKLSCFPSGKRLLSNIGEKNAEKFEKMTIRIFPQKSISLKKTNNEPDRLYRRIS